MEEQEQNPLKEKNRSKSDSSSGAGNDPGELQPPLPNRRKCPGVRVIGGRIYDSELGNTCHQCRQKTLDFAASCKNQKGNKRCTIKFCHKCLLNRYGEKAEEMEALKDWKCPKCRNLCNCSVCMKKRGCKPTGSLVLQAKTSGYLSVSELLNVNGLENFDPKNNVNNKGACTEKTVVGPIVASPRKMGKENNFDGNKHKKSHPQDLGRKLSKEEPREKEIRAVLACIGEEEASVKENRPKKRTQDKMQKSSDCNPAKMEENMKGKNRKVHEGVTIAGPKRCTVPEPITKEKFEEENGMICKHADKINIDDTQAVPKPTENYRELKKDATIIEQGAPEFNIPLPEAVDLTVVAGIELPPVDVGDALQFLEFCAAFGKILDIRKGQPETILRELFHGRRGRRAQYSSVAQFHIQLLTLILKESCEEPSLLNSENLNDSWLQALGKCISESECSFEDLPSGCFEQGGYDKLDSSKKLKLLNFLCDEALGTTEMRTWTEDQHKIYKANKKEAKEKVSAARNKEKCMRQKLQDEIAKAIIERNGAPLSTSEHTAIVSQIKAEVKQAHVELLEAMDADPSKKDGLDAIRTDPVLLDGSGRAYWRLKGYSFEPHILLQDMGCRSTDVPSEKWFTYTVDEKLAIEKYMSFIRRAKKPTWKGR